MDRKKRIKHLQISTSKYKALLNTPTILPHDCYYRSLNSLIKPDVSHSIPSSLGINIPDIKFDLPYPIYPPVVFDSMQDPCLDHYNAKAKLKDMVDRKRSQYKKDKCWLNEEFVSKSDSVELPVYLVEIGKLMKDVDLYCNANYDQYYAGGILCKAEINGDMHLLRPTSTNEICISSIENPNKVYFMKPRNSRIYNLQIYNYKQNNFLCIRQKNRLSYVHIDVEDESLNNKTLWKGKSEIPFIDFKPRKTEVSTLCIDYKFKIHDVETKQEILNNNFPIEAPQEYNLGQIDYINKNHILFMGRKYVHLFDKRSLETKSTVILESDHLMCNDLYTFTLSKADSNYAYLVTKHEISKFDLRQMEIVKRWTHFLDHYPISCKAEVTRDNEFLCVNSFREMVMLQINDTENYLPFKIPHILETFEEYNLRNGIVLKEKLRKRLEFSVAGTEIYLKPHSNEMKIFSVNSIGDVFCNKSNFKMNKKLKCMPVIELSSWIELFSDKAKELVVNTVRYMGDVKSVITSLEDDHILDLDKYVGDNNEQIEKLHNFIDVSKFALGEIWADEDDRGPSKKK